MSLPLKGFVKKFCDKYFIKILSDSKRWARSNPHHVFFTDEQNKDVVYNSPLNETEPLLTIEVPLSRLEDMAEVEHIFYNKLGDVAAGNIFEIWMDQQREEQRLRLKYPAIQEAFEAYSTLLHLAIEKPFDFKDLPK